MPKTPEVLEVPRAVYAAMRALLAQAGYEWADGAVIDLQGLAIRPRSGSVNADVTVSTLLSSSTKEGRVELTLNSELTQMDLPKAREIVGMLQDAIEAAVSDQLLYAFLIGRVGMDSELAARALVDFRELRQGSRKTVYPS